MRRVTAAVIIENGRLLVTRRAPDQKLPGMWELPGGKMELGETPQQCLVRELREELAMDCEVGEILAVADYSYDHGQFQMLALATTRESTFALTVHDAYLWATPEELASMALAPADVDLVEQLLAMHLF